MNNFKVIETTRTTGVDGLLNLVGREIIIKLATNNYNGKEVVSGNELVSADCEGCNFKKVEEYTSIDYRTDTKTTHIKIRCDYPNECKLKSFTRVEIPMNDMVTGSW